MKATNGQSAIFYLGSILVMCSLGVMWLPLGILAAGVWLITLAVLSFDAAKKTKAENDERKR